MQDKFFNAHSTAQNQLHGKERRLRRSFSCVPHRSTLVISSAVLLLLLNKLVIDCTDCAPEIFVLYADDDVELAGTLVNHLNIDTRLSK